MTSLWNVVYRAHFDGGVCHDSFVVTADTDGKAETLAMREMRTRAEGRHDGVKALVWEMAYVGPVEVSK